MRFAIPRVLLAITLAVLLPISAFAQGSGDRAGLLVAGFSSQPEDALTASALSEAFRNGLGDYDMVQLMDPDELQMTLETMRLPPGAQLTEAVALEAAVRRGIPLVLVGDLTPVGTAYELSIRLIDPADGTVHLSMEERASSAEETQEAVEGMVSTLCDQMEESLPNVTNRPRLPAVTTSSLEALQALAAARVANSQRNYPEALPLVEEAVEKDPSFAEGWRFLGMVLNNLGQDPDRRVEALTRAYELCEDVPEPERLNIMASYFTSANVDYGKAVETLELLNERYPNRAQWNNLGIYYPWVGENEKARDALQNAVNQGASDLTTANLISAAVRINDLETARATLDLREERGIGAAANLNYAATIAYLSGDRDEARRLDLAGAEAATAGAGKATDLRLAGLVDAIEGRVASFHQRMAEANDLWMEADAVNTVFANHVFLAFFDAIALNQGDKARSRVEEALSDPAIGNPDPTPIRAGDLAFVGMPTRAREVLSEWDSATPAGLRPAFVEQIHRANGMMALAENRTEEGLGELQEAVRTSFGSPYYEGELALAYEQAEMPDSALAAYQRYLDAPNFSRRWSDAIFLARAYERLGQLHEARGEVEKAIKFHTLFVELWSEADPELQPRVEAARTALERLKG